MTELINIITSKPDWQNKINDNKIVAKWKDELAKQNVSAQVLDSVIELLKDYSEKTLNNDKTKKQNPSTIKLGIIPENVSIMIDCNCRCCICDEDKRYNKLTNDNACTCKVESLNDAKEDFLNDSIIIFHKDYDDEDCDDEDCDDEDCDDENYINDAIKKELIEHVNHLEKSIPIDYHPGSNNQVINLVHPSMFCFVKNVSKIINYRNHKISDENILFQWLPSEVSVKNHKVCFNSYINNLDELTNIDLYVSIAKILEKFVPRFEDILEQLHNSKRIKKYVPLTNFQVIVKLANTVLTPDKPDYPAGSWHLEGLPHEKIIATGIYYYEMNNITENYLNFRSTLKDRPYVVDDYVKTHFDLGDKDSNVYLGRVETKEDLCLVFPNFLQHQVSNFSLKNKNKIGTRKILVFFLIDPSSRIISTKDIRPQQNTISLEDARLYRELLMFQRKYDIISKNKYPDAYKSDRFNNDMDSSFHTKIYSLCEH